MWDFQKIVAVIAIALNFWVPCVQASPNYHLVGWLNTLVPGGGQLLQGNYWEAGQQAAVEGGTFGWGYSLSKRSPLTLDGVPEDLPFAQSGIGSKTQTSRVCTKTDPRTHKCTNFVTRSSTTHFASADRTEIDTTRGGSAEILQEFGIKYHMINVFNSYREAARADGGGTVGDQKIDQSDTGQLFLEPFRLTNLFNPWVGLPLLIVAGSTVIDYNSQIHSSDFSAIQPMTAWSNGLIGFNFMVWQPFGSGAPEEMFYRGFLQHEFYSWVNSPFFSIPLSAAAFSFSHGSSGRVGAAIAGSYLGFLAHQNQGNLAPGITLHFWSVVLLGIETFILTKRAQGITPPVGAQFSLAM